MSLENITSLQALENKYSKESGLSMEEKLAKVEALFSALDITALEREDIETHARGYNVTDNIKYIERFKNDLLGEIEGLRGIRTHDIPCFEKLIGQKEYQDIIWAAAEVNPKIFDAYEKNKKFNTFVQERPEFLESNEVHTIYKQHIAEGIQRGTLFEGYTHTKKEHEGKIPETKKDFFAKTEHWSTGADKEFFGGALGLANKTIEEGKKKRDSIPDQEKEYIVNLHTYEYDKNYIDQLSEEEKKELQEVFLKKIQNAGLYARYSAEKVFADEILEVGSKLGVSKEETHEYVYIAMMQGILEQNPPMHNIDQEFPVVYNKIRDTLSDPEKRKQLLDDLYKSVAQTNENFKTWDDSLQYVQITEDERKKVVENYLDFSQGEEGNIFGDKQCDIFGYGWWREEDCKFSKEQQLQAFETMNVEQKAQLLKTYSGKIEKLAHLSFSTDDILEFAASSIENKNFISPYEVDRIYGEVRDNFPTTGIEKKDIAIKSIFKNTRLIRDIQESLQRNNIELSPNEILAQFESPEKFVEEQIRGATPYNLEALEDFKRNPDTPALPTLPFELFSEIKKSIVRLGNHGDIEFTLARAAYIPKEYQLEFITNTELQSCFIFQYKGALKYNQSGVEKLRFLISKSEDLKNAEKENFEEYIQEGDFYGLLSFHKTLYRVHRDSPVLKQVESFFMKKVEGYGHSLAEPLHVQNMEKVTKAVAGKKLEALDPEHLEKPEAIREWLNIVYADSEKKYFPIYNEIKKLKDFNFFKREIIPQLYKDTADKFSALILSSVRGEARDIDWVVRFTKDITHFGGGYFVKENWDFLYQELQGATSEEYAEKINLMAKLRPLISSPFIPGVSFDKLFKRVSSYNKEEQDQLCQLIDTAKYDTSDNSKLDWGQNTISYVIQMEDLGVLSRSPDQKEKINTLFSGEYKNVALSGMTADWRKFLQDPTNSIPPQALFVSEIIDQAGGAANLKHIESLGNLIHQARVVLEKDTTAEKTVTEMKTLFAEQEARFAKEKWSQDEISEFYNLSRDIIEAAPSLYTAFAPILETISAKDMKKFMSDIFPFYQTQLVVMQNISGENVSYDPRSLVTMRQSIQQFSSKITEPGIFESEKTRLLEIAKDGFRDRFGLLKIPAEFTKENLRTIQNTIRYMGNISERTPQREALISLYLGLELEGKWSDFRAGSQINFGEYISQKQLKIIEPILEEKAKGYDELAEVAGISGAQMPRFQEILQGDVSNNLIGSVQTIDIKLGNIKRNVDELVDIDIYQTQKEKDLLTLFLKDGKSVSGVMAKLYGIATGKSVQLSEDELRIKKHVETIFDTQEWTPEKVKNIQDEVQPIALVTNMVRKMEEEKIEEAITELQEILTPNEEIITIFNKLGEEFHQESGALALSKDLAYLENLVVKENNKITAEERVIVLAYIESIRDKMKDMETVLDHTKQYFDKLKKSSHLENNELLKNRVSEIEKIIYSQDTSTVITSQMTKDLNLVIENMRQCLGCMRKEANNDTNLSFGDYNKFFMMNKSEKEKGSISDEIVFFVPVTLPGDTKEMSFVMDQIYGTKSADVLVGNISALYKKYQSLKKEFPETKVSISVTDAAMRSVGLTKETLENRLRESLNKKIETNAFEDIVANIPKSSLSDNYVEFGSGGGPRQSGDRVFSGLVVR